MTTDQAALPAEILCHIVGWLGPREVVRLRTVSKQFHDISYLVQVWRTIYMNAPLPRHAGPFRSQPVQFLERTAIRSEQLAKTWTTQPMRDISTLRIPLDGSSSYRPKILHGRWVIVYDPSVGFVVHDVDARTAPGHRQVLWKPDETIEQWDACGVTSVDGPIVYLMFGVIDLPGSILPSKLLEFRMDDSFSCLYHSFSLDVPAESAHQPIYLDGGRGPFLYISCQDLVLDARTRRLFKIPPPSSEKGRIPPGWRLGPVEKAYTLLTRTHVITLYLVLHDSFGYSTLVRAWTSPPESYSIRSGTLPLQLSHEGMIDGHVESVTLIRNSTIDPITEATHVGLLEQAHKENAGVHFSCVDLTLPKHTPMSVNSGTVLPMVIKSYNVLRVNDVLKDRRRFVSCHFDSSDDGHARGFWQVRPLRSGILPCNWDVVRFTIDASKEGRCTFTIGHSSHPQWKEIDHPFRIAGGFWMDCLTGRFCYRDQLMLTADEVEHIIVVDVV